MGRNRLASFAVRASALGALGAGLVGCATPEPVFYPNATLESVGRTAADADVARCRTLAQSSGASGGGAGQVAGDVAADTAGRAGAGAAAGAAGGAIRGNAGTGAAVGAATAASWGLVRGGFRALFGRRDPDPIERRFVERCLAERGYEVIGWR